MYFINLVFVREETNPCLALKAIVFVFLVLFLNTTEADAQKANLSELKHGGLLFQNGECGPLCQAINEVTPAIYGQHFSHIGMVLVDSGQTFVIEATGDKVQKSTLKNFIGRTKDGILVGRLKKPYRYLVDSAMAFAEAQLDLPYDDAFLYDNSKYYCAELIYDAFKAANKDEAFFQLQPMTFKSPDSDEFFPGWVRYYAALNLPIPEGEPGCNPGSIGQSKKIEIYRYQP